MTTVWICTNCGTANEPRDNRCYSCMRKRTNEPSVMQVIEPSKPLVEHASMTVSTSDSRCAKCRTEIPVHNNACPKCGEFARANRLEEATDYPVAPDAPAFLCFVPAVDLVLLLAEPDENAERLYVCGAEDLLAISGEAGEYYRVNLPGGEAGYVAKEDGKLAEFGIKDVAQPLGYARPMPGYAAEVVLVQPTGEKETIYELKAEDRLPVVEERAKYYVVQLPNGMRGRLHKARVIRTLHAESLPAEKTVAIGPLLGAAALLGVGLVGALIGALGPNEEEDRMRRAFSGALRDRGY